MHKSKKNSNSKENLPKVNPELEGFEIVINEFGEIETSIPIDTINDFLNRKLYDKKLKNGTDDQTDLEDFGDSNTKD